MIKNLIRDVHNNCANVLKKMGRYKEAKQACVESLSVDPNNLKGKTSSILRVILAQGPCLSCYISSPCVCFACL